MDLKTDKVLFLGGFLDGKRQCCGGQETVEAIVPHGSSMEDQYLNAGNAKTHLDSAIYRLVPVGQGAYVYATDDVIAADQVLARTSQHGGPTK